MIGGMIVEAIPCFVRGEPRLWVNVHDKRERQDCAVFLEYTPAARSVSEGDKLWWQGQWAMWTPRSLAFSDYKIRRIGCSGVNRPARVAHPDERTGASDPNEPAKTKVC